MSPVHGDPRAVSVSLGAGRAIAFGEHLWYMDTSHDRTFMEWVMEQVSAGVVDPQPLTPPDRILSESV